MKWITRLDNLMSKIEKCAVIIAGFMVISLMLLITSEVVLRKLINFSIPGVYEISSQLMTGVCLFGIAYVQTIKEHISIDILADKFPLRLRKILEILSRLVAIVIISVFAYQTGIGFYESYQIGEYTIGLLPVPLWPGKLIISISLFLMAIRLILDLITDMADISKGSNYVSAENK